MRPVEIVYYCNCTDFDAHTYVHTHARTDIRPKCSIQYHVYRLVYQTEHNIGLCCRLLQYYTVHIVYPKISSTGNLVFFSFTVTNSDNYYSHRTLCCLSNATHSIGHVKSLEVSVSGIRSRASVCGQDLGVIYDRPSPNADMASPHNTTKKIF